MNLINKTVFKQNMINLSNWVDTTPVPEVIDTFTYDLYEGSNPLRVEFTEDEIKNKKLRTVANTSTKVGAEVMSFFINPYYWTHKISHIPTWYQNVVDAYKKNQKNN